MKLAYNPSDKPALTGVSSDNKDIIFDLSGIAIYARGVKFDGKTPTVFKKHTSANTGGYDGLVPVPSYTDNATRFLREDGTWVIPDKTTSIHWNNIDGKPDVFNPSQHIHTTNDIQSLTNYTKATELKDLTTSDTLNIALGKLEYKSNLGVTAYDWYRSVTNEDTDEHINKWNEIVNFLNGVTDTTLNGILNNFVNDLEVTGSGNAVTDVSKSNNKITVTKGNSFLPLKGGTLTGHITLPNKIYIRTESNSYAILGMDGNKYILSAPNKPTTIRSNGTLKHNDAIIWDSATLTNVSQLTNDANYTTTSDLDDILTALDNKADKATTLSGYGITDAYTKSQVDSALGGYLPLSGGAVSGTAGALEINRNDVPYLSAIKFSNTAGVLGYLGVEDNYQPVFYSANLVDRYDILHSGNYTNYTYSKSTIDSKFSGLGTFAYKSSIAFAELADKPTTLGGYGITDWNTAYQRSFNINERYDVGYYSVANGSNPPTHAPYGSLLVLPYRKASGNTTPDFGTQIFLPNGDDSGYPNDMFFRTSLGSSWNAWQRVLTDNNYTSYTYSQSTIDTKLGGYLPLSGGTITGNLIVGGILNTSSHLRLQNHHLFVRNNEYADWIVTDKDWQHEYAIIHSGNIGSQSVAYATSAGGADVIVLTYANQSINMGAESRVRLISITSDNAVDLGAPKRYVSGLSVMSNYVGWQLVSGASQWNNDDFYIRKIADNGVYLNWRQIAFLDSNVASATKLQTARTIWGQSFDGTGNVGGNLTLGYNKIYLADGNNSYYVGWNSNSQLEIKNYYDIIFSTSAERLRITNGGNVGIGTTSPTQKLHVNGAGVFTNTGSTTYSTDGITIGAGDMAVRYITCYGKTSVSYINMGYAPSTNNCAELVFSYVGNGSAENYSALSLYGAANQIQVYPGCTKSTKYINAPGFVHPDYWSSAYALTSNGGVAHIGSMSVNYANSAGNADTVDGLHSSSFMKFAHDGNNYVNASFLDSNLSQVANTYYIEFWDSGAGWFNSQWGKVIATAGFVHSGYNSSAYALTSNGGAAKIADMSVNYASSAGSVAWGNVSGKPSTFTPSSHTHSNITIGDHVSGTTKPSGYSEGLSVKNVYSGASTGFPYNYGNSLTIRGNGTTQIMITWNAAQTSSDPNVAQDIYVRSQRDSAGDNWSKWTTLITDANIGSQSVNYANSAGYAANSTYLYASDSPYRYGDSAPYYMRMRYHTNGDNRWYLSVYPETPKTVAVDHAYTSDRLYGYSSSPNNSHPGHGARVFYSWDTGQAGSATAGYSNGITIGSHPNDTAYGFQIVQNMWDDRTYTRRYNGGWQSWKTLAWTSDIPTSLPANGGNADTVDGYHASDFAKIGTYNNLTHAGNEFTFASSAFSGTMWINYRTASGSTDGNITTYLFGNGKGGSLASISSGYFSGTAAGADTVDGYHIAVQSSAGTNASTIYFVI